MYSPERGAQSTSCLARRLYKVSFLIASAAILLLIGCKQAASSPVRVDHEISPQPVHVGTNTVLLTLTDALRKPVTGASITLEADMSHAGMKPVFAEAKEIHSGRYEARLAFEMAGDWVVLVHGSLANGQKLEQQFDVRGVQPN